MKHRPQAPRLADGWGRALLIAGFCMVFGWMGLSSLPAASPAAPAASPLAASTGLSIHLSGVGAGSPAKLEGADARMQAVATLQQADGGPLDVTSAVQWSIEPANIAKVDATGFIEPLADGKAKLTARHASGQSAAADLHVSRFADPRSINFANQIVPIFTRMECNSGGCHGKMEGQNGFRLSLLGFEPSEDYEYLVNEGRGRRLVPAAPEQSLLLLKATGRLPHGGGSRLDEQSLEYKLIHRWIGQGMPTGSPEDPALQRISVFPAARLIKPGGRQQLTVTAHYSDGSTQDVTRMARLEPNIREMAETSESGLVSFMDQTGDVAIMVRYQGQATVFQATLPLGAPVGTLPDPVNYIDRIVFAKLKLLGMPPSAMSDDSTFLRRVTLDIAGRLPTAAEARAFLADGDPAKRDKAIDRLLDSPEYADYFANKWSSLLRNRRTQELDMHGTYSFHAWLRRSIAANMPYDQLVGAVLAASGEVDRNPAVVWYRQAADVSTQLEDTAQLFLGVRIQCAKCHHHPFEKWSQDDYYGLAAFFSQVGRKPGRQPGEQRIFHKYGRAEALNPKTSAKIAPTGLGGPPMTLAPEQDPRLALVNWMSRADNPFFAHSLANRYWKHFMGRGLVEPEDDMRTTNPPSNPELLDALAKDFADSKFDLKALIRTICRSRVYQLSAEPNAHNARDQQNFSRYYPRRLNAEVMLDAINTISGARNKFADQPEGVRAVSLPDSGFRSYFLSVFGRPEGASACECERISSASLAQSLHLLNSDEIRGKVSDGEGRAAALAADPRPAPDKIRELYMVAFSRPPTERELAAAGRAVEVTASDNPRQAREAWEDLIWVLMNTKEFMFNR